MSRLETISKEFREKTLAKNAYSSNDDYGVSHPNAISDGDNKGKGENNGSVGSAADIQAREKSLVKNKFSPNKPYDSASA
jgi:hypothetical protein